MNQHGVGRHEGTSASRHKGTKARRHEGKCLAIDNSFASPSVPTCLRAYVPSPSSPSVPPCLRAYVPSPSSPSVPTCLRAYVPSPSSPSVPPCLRAYVPSSYAFTLIELLVVIGIIGILVGLLIPVVGKMRMSGYEVSTRNEILEIGNACHHYYDDFRAFPGPISNND